MSKPSGGLTALIVDDDLGFVWWLGDRFHEAGYQIVPALNAPQADALVKDLNLKINVAVVNPGLTRIRALIKRLRQADGAVKIIAIRNATGSDTISIQPDATLERPSGWEPVSRDEWLRKLRRILRRAEQTVAMPKISGYPSP